MESENFWRFQHTDAVDFTQDEPTSCTRHLRMANCKALQPLTAEFPEPRLGRVPLTDRIGVATAPQDVQQGLSSKQMKFVRTCSGIVSRPSICLTLKDKARDRHIGQSRELQRHPSLCCCALRHDNRGGLGTNAEAQLCRVARFCPTRPPAIVPTLWDQSFTITTILTQQSWRVGICTALQIRVRHFLGSSHVMWQ